MIFAEKPFRASKKRDFIEKFIIWCETLHVFSELSTDGEEFYVLKTIFMPSETNFTRWLLFSRCRRRISLVGSDFTTVEGEFHLSEPVFTSLELIITRWRQISVCRRRTLKREKSVPTSEQTFLLRSKL